MLTVIGFGVVSMRRRMYGRLCRLAFDCPFYLCITFVAPDSITKVVLQVPLQIVSGYYAKLKFILQIVHQIQNVEKSGHFVHPLNQYSNWHMG